MAIIDRVKIRASSATRWDVAGGRKEIFSCGTNLAFAASYYL